MNKMEIFLQCCWLFYRGNSPKQRGPAKHPSLALAGKEIQKGNVENFQRGSAESSPRAGWRVKGG